eukprot:1138158-Pelagomonas_calceolata.AAC.1
MVYIVRCKIKLLTCFMGFEHNRLPDKFRRRVCASFQLYEKTARLHGEHSLKQALRLEGSSPVPVP